MASNRYKTSATWDGHELHELFVVEQIERPVMGGGSPVTQSIGLTPGVALVGMRYDAPKVSLTLACVADTMDEIRQAWATLAGWLHVDGARALVFGDDDGWYYAAVPQGGADASLIGYTGERATITFLVPDARMWALKQEGHVGLVSCTVDVPEGQTPVEPVITLRNAAPSTDGYVRLRATEADSGDVQVMTIPLDGMVSSLVVDCASRSITGGGQHHMVSLDEDFFLLPAGTSWTIQQTAGQHAENMRVTWRPGRWC